MSGPNLLVIHTDQQSAWTLGAYGGTLIETPNIDRIGVEGALCRQFFTNSAVCTPSRGCLVTGRYPHSHGAYTNNIPLGRDEVTFAQVLKDRGYETGYAGKWHLDGTPRPGWIHPERSMGFDDCEFMFNRGHWKKIEDSPMEECQPTIHPYNVVGDEKTFTTDWLTDKTIEFLERPRENPFCYMVSIPDPHAPVWVRPPYDTMFKPEEMPLPATLDDPNTPSWAGDKSKGFLRADNPERETQLRKFKALYCGEVKLIDDCVGRILDCLEAKGVLDDTIVVFTVDHGEYLGEHGLMNKNQLYETAYRVPMLIRWPEKIPAGTVVDRVLSTVDFQPTILNLMRVTRSGREEGRDASALLRGESIEWVDEAYIHHSSLEQAGIFTDEYELAHVRDGESILFDRKNDPDQVANLANDPAHAETVRELTARIVRHNIEVDAPAAKWLHTL
jgi:arylsulfatase A-like enzyme